MLDQFLRTGAGRSNYSAGILSLRRRGRDLSFDLNYTLGLSLDQAGAVQNSAGFLENSFDPNTSYGPSAFDRRHVLNANWVYNLPAGRGHRFRFGNWLDGFLSDWRVTGIFRASSGLPLIISQGAPAFGGGNVLPNASGAILIGDRSEIVGDKKINENVAGSGGVGTTGDPANGGSGLNLFADPEKAFNGFRRIRLSEDGRSGRANPIRGPKNWNLDLSLGKKTAVTEQVALSFSFDFFNIFNRVNFSSPALNLTNPASFGVITNEVVPSRRQSSSRWIQFGFRVEF